MSVKTFEKLTALLDKHQARYRVVEHPPHDGASVLACALSSKSAVKNPKNFEHWFSQRLWVKFAMFLLNSTSVDAGAIIGALISTRLPLFWLISYIHHSLHNPLSEVEFFLPQSSTHI